MGRPTYATGGQGNTRRGWTNLIRPTYATGGQGNTRIGDNVWSQSERDKRYPGGKAPTGYVFNPIAGQAGNYTLDPYDPYAGIMESNMRMMERQAAMQAEYMNQMSLLQEEQLRMQEEAAKAAMVENKKNPSDYAQANADDTARKQLLRRGLMSTFTRYGNANAGGGGKATKLGGITRGPLFL